MERGRGALSPAEALTVRAHRLWIQQAFNSYDQILRLKGLSDQLVGFDCHRLFSHGLVYHAGHENYGRSSEAIVLLDERKTS